MYWFAGHAYSVTKVVPEYNLVRIRNPHGKTEWTGPWSDNSEEWETLTPKEKKLLDFKKLDDGEFYMHIDDYVKNFQLLSICNLSNFWNEEQIFGSWKISEKSAGGSEKSTFAEKISH